MLLTNTLWELREIRKLQTTIGLGFVIFLLSTSLPNHRPCLITGKNHQTESSAKYERADFSDSLS